MTDPELHLNTRKLKELREQRGLARIELARQIGTTSEVLGRVEGGESSISLRNLRAIVEALALDPLDIMELLRVKPIPLTLVIKFRAACRREGTTPLQALIDFMEVYSSD